MPCGSRPLVKKWDKPKYIQKIMQSRYEQNERTVKQHWHTVLKNLENSYKDDKFWETQSEVVRGLVGELIFKRIQKIFNLPLDKAKYEPRDEQSLQDIVRSELFFQETKEIEVDIVENIPTVGDDTQIDMKSSFDDEEEEEEEESDWESEPSQNVTPSALKKSKSVVISKSFVSQKKSSRHMAKSHSIMISGVKVEDLPEDSDDLRSCKSDDDLIVHPEPDALTRHRHRNPHHRMLYCHESETDMIKWDSNYKKKSFEVSASDEFSKKAEIMTKQICKDFFDWWQSLGNLEFKTEIKRPQDVEDLFQVWFDEHASTGLVLETKILPCIIPAVAKATDLPHLACPNVLKRQIAYDIIAETSPELTMAFGRCMPQYMKHKPPDNNTLESWKPFQIPEDLRTMACVFEDVQHLTSTKEFQQWLAQRPNLPMAPFLRMLNATHKKAALATSDFILMDKTGMVPSAMDLALPVSQFSMELKEVLSKLMNN